jgi:predicted RNA binding protein YcfA (HicA-like mRNA interferase family)
MPKLPVISGKEMVSALKKAGFAEVRQKGSHVSLKKPRQGKHIGRSFQCTKSLERALFLTFSSRLD